MSVKKLRNLLLAASVVLAPASMASPYHVAPAGKYEMGGKSPVLLVQSGDATYRVNELEQQVRQLNGKVEDLTFQLLQLQEQIRKMQEDNEQRFLDIEENKSGSLNENKTRDTASLDEQGGDKRLEKPATSGAEPATDVNRPATDSTALGEPPRNLGTLTFDDDGNVINSGSNNGDKTAALPKMKLPGVFNDGVDGGVEAAEFGPTPSAVVEVGQRALANKRYKRAESAIRAYLKAWPNDPQVAEARYYLGQALFWQREYVPAANIFLDTHNEFPRAATAPDNLLHLGLALAGLNQREVACVTYSEVLKQYPQSRGRLQNRVEAEQTSAKC